LTEPVVFTVRRDDRRTKPALVLDVGDESQRIHAEPIRHAGKLRHVGVSFRAVRVKERDGDRNRAERPFQYSPRPKRHGLGIAEKRVFDGGGDVCGPYSSNQESRLFVHLAILYRNDRSERS